MPVTEKKALSGWNNLVGLVYGLSSSNYTILLYFSNFLK